MKEGDSQEAEKVQAFVLKLARARNFDEMEAAEAIASQLRRIEQNSYFPEVYNSLDTSLPNAEIRALDNRGRRILDRALRLYGSK